MSIVLPKPKPKPIDAEVRQRIRDAFSRLLWDRIRPWVYMETESDEATTFDGRVVFFESHDAPGAKQFFWNDWIEPFLKELCRTEIATTMARARANGWPMRRALRELRGEFLAGFIRLYWTMSDVHRQAWPVPPRGPLRRDTSQEVDRMMAFLDEAIAAALAGRGD
jgi:hypothetical protein